MRELRGKAVSDCIKKEIEKELPELIKRLGRKPRLEIIRVGDNEADGSYARSAMKKTADFGMEAELKCFPKDISEAEFASYVKEKSDDSDTDGILILRPLPEGLEEASKAVLKPEKDLDGMTEKNQALVFSGDPSGFAPCTAAAVIRLLKHYGVEVSGKHVAVAGRSNVVGKPLSMLLLSENATVTLCHSRTPDELLKKQLANADIICTAVGKVCFLKSDSVKDGAAVVDAGINVNEEGRLCGDADYDAIKDKCSFISPVPGGLGAVTTAVLCENLFKAALRHSLR